MRRSQSEKAQTRARIVATAARRFLEKGLAAVGMRDIMTAAGLTQGGFYRHFRAKEELVAEANRAAFEQLQAVLERESTGGTPGEGLDRIVTLYLGQARSKAKPYLCPLAQLGAELGHADRAVRRVAMDGHRRLVQLVADRLVEIPREEALAVASGVVSAMVGAVTLAGIAPDLAAGQAILEDAQSLIRARVAAARER